MPATVLIVDDEKHTRPYALRFLRELGPDAVEALPKLREMEAAATSRQVKAAYLKTIAEIEEEAKE